MQAIFIYMRLYFANIRKKKFLSLTFRGENLKHFNEIYI